MTRETATHDDSDFSPVEQKIVDAIQDALDDDNFKKVVEQLKSASASTNAAVRARAVGALQWFGDRALPELTPFLADGDEDVRSDAMSAIEQALSQMEDEKAKATYIESVMKMKGACTEDGMVMLSGQLNGLTDETLAVEAAVRVIESGSDPKAVEAMKEVYEFTTGDAYTTKEVAETWCVNKRAEAADEEQLAENAEPAEQAEQPAEQ